MKKITTPPNNNCLHPLHHLKFDSLFHMKDSWMAHTHILILSFPDSSAHDATSPLACVTVAFQPHPPCLGMPLPPHIKISHASPSHPFSLLLASHHHSASIYLPLPLLPLISLSAFILFVGPLLFGYPAP